MAIVSNEIELQQSVITWSKAPDPVTNKSLVPRGRVIASTEDYGQEITGAGAGDTDLFYANVELPKNWVYRLNSVLWSVQHATLNTANNVYAPSARVIGITGPRDKGTASLVNGSAQQTSLQPQSPIATYRMSYTTLPAAGYVLPFVGNEFLSAHFLRDFESTSFGGAKVSFPAGLGVTQFSPTANPGGTWYVQAFFDFLMYDVEQSFEQELNTVMFWK